MPYRWRHSCLLGRIQDFKRWEFKFISELRKEYVNYVARNVFCVTNSSATGVVGGGGGAFGSGLRKTDLKKHSADWKPSVNNHFKLE